MAEYKNLTDDTGMDIVHALRRIAEARGGPRAVIEPINRRDNAFNVLDRTGRKMAEALEWIASAPGGSASYGPATRDRDGLMSREDKAALEDLLGQDPLGQTDLVRDMEDLPDTAGAGSLRYCMGIGLLVYGEDGWTLCAQALGEEEVEALLDAAGIG